jgi:nucleotide-binding universal stress UspA family protein
MENLKRILVATDFSEYAARAEARAAMLCEDMRLRVLEVVSVEPPAVLDEIAMVKNRSIATAEGTVKQLQNKLMPLCAGLERDFAIRCEPAVRIGLPVAEIISQAEEVAADLLVTGSHGGSRTDDACIGYIVQRLMRMATRPMLIVFGQPVTSYCHVLVVVNGASARAATMAVQIAPRAHFTFLQTYDEPAAHDPLRGDALSGNAELARVQLNRFVAGLGHAPRSILRMASSGPLRAVVTEYVDKYKPDLVVLADDARECIEEIYSDVRTTASSGMRHDTRMNMDCLAA